MSAMKTENNKVCMIAHRGRSGIETENTCAAFVAAGNRSFWGIESDVHVTKDGKYVMIHDDDTYRVSGVKRDVEKSTLEELQSIPLYNEYEGMFRTDLRIPTLTDYIAICKRYKKKAVLEFKNRITYEHIAVIVELIKRMDYLEHVIFISFVWDNLMDLRKFLPHHPVQFLTGDINNAIVEKLIAYKIELDAWHSCITKDVIDKLHANGRTVNCWTVDDPEIANGMIALGVDYITTDILE